MPANSTGVYFRGDRMRELRNALGISQYVLAERANVSRPQITNIETGLTDPGFETAVKIAKALGTSIDYLAGMSDNPGKRWRVKKAPVLANVEGGE